VAIKTFAFSAAAAAATLAAAAAAVAVVSLLLSFIVCWHVVVWQPFCGK